MIVYTDTPEQVETVLQSHPGTIPFVKLTSGSVKQYGERSRKELVRVCERHGARAYLGGGITEKRIRDLGMDAMCTLLHRDGITAVEVSSDGVETPVDFASHIRILRNRFDRVLVEIGTKRNELYGGLTPLSTWLEEGKIAREEGADYVILEGGGGGDVGIYHDNKTLRSLLLQYLLDQLSLDPSSTIFEAPETIQQAMLIAYVDPMAFLGNTYPTIHVQLQIAHLRLGAQGNPSFAQARETNGIIMRDIVRELAERAPAVGVDFEDILQSPIFQNAHVRGTESLADMLDLIRSDFDRLVDAHHRARAHEANENPMQRMIRMFLGA